MTFKEYVDVFQALLTPVIAILALYIAWQQYKVQHRTFNVQLYERRYVVFKAFMSFLADVMREGTVSYQRLGQFYAEASEADLLFSEAIPNMREELYKRGIDLADADQLMYPSDGSAGLPVGSERTTVARQKAEHLKWFFDQISRTKTLFKTEMQLH
jgi:hypothetical protein